MAQRNTLKLFASMGLVATIVARFSPSLNSPFRSTDRAGIPLGHLAIGAYGEKVARHWLITQRCKILHRNFRGPRRGEIDIVAREKSLLLFIEVKTRRHGSPGRPLDAVDKRKQALIERGANAWLKRLGTRNLPWRFDVVEVYLEEGKKPRLLRIRDAF